MVKLLILLSMMATEISDTIETCLRDYYSGLEEDSPSLSSGMEFYDEPLDLRSASPAEFSRLPGMTYLISDEWFSGVKTSDSTGCSALDRYYSSLVGRFNGMAPVDAGAPLTATLRIKAGRRWGSTPPSSPLGPPVSNMERFALSKDCWRAGALLDRDAYEADFDDLKRLWFGYEGDKLSLWMGDLSLCAGEGVTLWTKPSYYSPEGAAAEAGASRPKLSPASNTSQNHSVRGAGATVSAGGWNLLLVAGNTPQDAVVGSDGSPQRLSDEGLHRNEGEAKKRNSVRERLIAAVLQHLLEIKDMKLSLGAVGWMGDYNPAFTAAPSASRPFPQTGGRTGAIGLNGSLSSAASELAFENSWDAGGTPAHKSRIGWRSKGGISECVALRLTLYSLPLRFTNPRGRGVEGRTGVRGAAWAVEKRLRMPLNLIVASGSVEENLWRTSTRPSPPIRTTVALSGDLDLPGDWKGGFRISRKSEDEPEMDEGSPNSSSSGKGAARLRIRGERRFRLTALRLWAEGVSSDEPDVNPGAAISASARWSRPLSGVVLSLASGGEFFSTDRSAPIYSLDLVPPDIFSSVRLAGKGARIWGEAQIAVPNIGTISLLWADFHPWSCGASRGRTLYLSFNQIWRNPE